MSIGEAALSAFFKVAFDRLASRILLTFAQVCHVESEVKKLRTILGKIDAVLNDAEDKQCKDRRVKEWLDELTYVAYDAEDVIEQFAYEAVRWELETARQGVAEGQVWKGLRASVEGFIFNSAIHKKIMEITERLDDIAKQQRDLGLQDCVKGKSFGFKERRQTTSLDNESFVYGRDEEKEKIIGLLLRDEDKPCDSEISVIPIVGMGGVGKTTLAQLVYNDDRVKNHFNMKAWACVSDDFDVFRITMAILESATENPGRFENLEPLQNRLKNVLDKKKFLLVLDDIWNKTYTDWDDLRKPFRAGAKGSKIIVTTRDQNVASITAGRYARIHYLKPLSDDDCWLLFKKHADTGHQPKLESIGREIVKKCKGLPLAAKTLGGLLRCKVEEDEWENILNSDLWDLPEDESGIIPALKLSYHHLPAHLKRCFAYCAIFPKDYEFGLEDLILLWMAEGFLQQLKGMKEMEDLGREYFSELLSRSFFQQSTGTSETFVMHDLINDLAQCVAGDICFKLEDGRQNGTPEKTRHSSYARTRYDASKKFKAFCEMKGLRTLLSLPIQSYSTRSGSCILTNEKILPDLLPNLSFLRALSLAGYSISQLPDSIGDLKLLRYLNLSDTSIKSLPHSTKNLYNLQSLLLNHCRNLSKLPSDMGNLINLRHLNLSDTYIESLPHSTSNLSNLQSLLLNRCIYLSKLPPDMGNLINLRHLYLSDTYIESLPHSTSNLSNLQSLLLNGCKNLSKLPPDMGNLINMRHRGIRGCNLQEMPLQMGKMTKLHTLSQFFVGKFSGSGIGELGELLDLRGRLAIIYLNNVIDACDATKANLKNKKHLDVVEMRWSSEFDDKRNERVEIDVLDKLQLHTNLRCLLVRSYGGTSFPSWIGDPSFYITELLLYDCKKCTSLPPLGVLPLLKNLTIAGMIGVKNVGVEFYGAGNVSVKRFPSLKSLVIRDLLEWEEWFCPSSTGENFEVFPCLLRLSIRNCPKLLGNLPGRLPSLLVIRECPQLKDHRLVK